MRFISRKNNRRGRRGGNLIPPPDFSFRLWAFGSERGERAGAFRGGSLKKLIRGRKSLMFLLLNTSSFPYRGSHSVGPAKEEASET